MKNKFMIAVVALCVASSAVIGIALARPHWLPSGARIHLEKLPSWAHFRAGEPDQGEDAGLYCKEHGVPEKFCTLCHEELSKTLLLCPDHGNIPEDICTLCHPELEKKYKIEMCPKGHGLPKEFCKDCGKTTTASLPDDGWCATHNKPEALCVECLKDAKSQVTKASNVAAKVCRQPLPTVRLKSAKIVRQVGIATAPAVEELHSHKISANAEAAYDANRYAEISPRVAGFLREVRVDLGKVVRRGDVLAVVDSSEVSSAKTQYLTSQSALQLAQATFNRTKSLAASGSIAAKQELEAQTTLNQARASLMDAEQKLRNFGFVDAQLEEIVKGQDTRNLLEIVAPIDGSVVVRHAVKGEAVQPTSSLFAIADTSRMWLWIDIYENDIAKVAPGQPVSFTISGADPKGEGVVFLGEITWVGSEVSEKTRTTRVRSELTNPHGRLRSNQFGRADIQIDAEHKAVIVPKEAVQHKDNTDLVFLPQAEAGVYLPQRVMTKATDRNEFLEVTWGLKPGQKVVTNGAFLLKTEIMKGAIGAGCCE